MSDMLFSKNNFTSRHITIQQDCNSAKKQAWTNNNTLQCTDNVACTKNDRCSNGVCFGTPFTCLPCEECYNDTCRVKPGFCVINDGRSQKCFNHGDIRPGYPCQVKQLTTVVCTVDISYNFSIFWYIVVDKRVMRLKNLIIGRIKTCFLLEIGKTFGRI